jgi:hypothetical protein
LRFLRTFSRRSWWIVELGIRIMNWDDEAVESPQASRVRVNRDPQTSWRHGRRIELAGVKITTTGSQAS